MPAKAVIAALVVAFLASILLVGPAQAKHQVELRGQIVEMHGDNFRHARLADQGLFFKSDGKLYRLPESAVVHVGQTGTARGEIRDGRLELTNFAASGEAATLSGSSTSASAAVSGVKRVAVILFNFSNDTSQPFTPASVGTTYFATGSTDRSVANYFKEVSWGQLQITGQVFGWYTIAATNQTCDPGTWAIQADAAAKAAGVDLTGYDSKTYVYPGVGLCGWGGFAQMPGNENWINGNPSVGLMAHELGHNFGLNHAISTSCTLANGDKVAFGPNCTTSEYGDQYDLMGASSMAYHLNEWHRAMLGFTNDIQTVSADGTYTLSPVETQSGSPHALRIPRGDGTYFDLEYRQSYGNFDAFSSTASAVNGVMIREVSSYSIANKPMLIDTTPQTPSFADAPLAAGQTFADPTTGITVTTLSVSSSGAQVQIQVRAGDFTPPSVSISSPSDGGSATLPTTVSVSATDNVGVAKVELYRQRVGQELAPGTLVGTDTAAPYDFSWVNGQNGQYAFTAVAYDTSGISAVSPTVTVNATQSDTTPPTDPTGFRATSITQTSVTTAWTASTDNVGVAYYQMYVNGAKAGTTTDTSYTFTGLVCGTGYSLSAQAFDLAGNKSPGVSISAWTTACGGDTQPPSTPTNVQAVATSGSTIAVSWQASTDNVGIAGYRIYRDGTQISQTSSTSFTDSGLAGGKTYTYTVTAYDAAGNVSTASNPVSVPTPSAADTQAPTAPGNLQGTSGKGRKVALSWLAATDNVGLASYRIFRDGVAVATISAGMLTYTDSPGRGSHTYYVIALDLAGNQSAPSNSVTV